MVVVVLLVWRVVVDVVWGSMRNSTGITSSNGIRISAATRILCLSSNRLSAACKNRLIYMRVMPCRSQKVFALIEELASDVYFFEEGDPDNKKLLGGKGAGLAKMTQLGLPVPPGFTISTQECTRYYENNKRLSEDIKRDVRKAMGILEKKTGHGFGDPKNPLLVSVRSGSAVSMPGMMDTVLNVGLNEKTLKGLIDQTDNPRFAYDAYRRFIQLFGKVVLHVKDEKFPKTFDEGKASAEELKEAAKRFKAVCQKETLTTRSF